jgi:hypothetical protein
MIHKKPISSKTENPRWSLLTGRHNLSVLSVFKTDSRLEAGI